MKDDFNAVNECLGFGTPAVPGSFNGAFFFFGCRCLSGPTA